MKKVQHIILYIFAAALTVGCGGGENGRKAQPSDTLHTVEKVWDTFYQDPERAFIVLDSAERLGAMNRTEATLLRAHFYSNDETTMDTARTSVHGTAGEEFRIGAQ